MLAGPNRPHAQDDDKRAPNIRREMKRVGFQRFARKFPRHARQCPRPDHIDAHRNAENHHGQRARLQMHLLEQQAHKRLHDDVHRSREKQSRFDERGEIFKFSVAVGVPGIRGLVGHPHRKPRQDGRDQVQPRMQRLGKHAQAARGGGQKHLEAHEDNRGADGPKRRHLLDRCRRSCDGGILDRDYTTAWERSTGFSLWVLVTSTGDHARTNPTG